MSMMTSQILKSVDFIKKKSIYLKNEKLCFFQMKKIYQLHIKVTLLQKKKFFSGDTI